MSKLSSEARAFVDATRFVDEPDAEDFDRVRSALATRLAAGGAVVSLAASAAASTAAPVANGVAHGAALVTSSASGGAALATSGAVATSAAVGAGVGTAGLGIPSTLAIAGKVAAWVIAVGLTGGAVGAVVHHSSGSRISAPMVAESAGWSGDTGGALPSVPSPPGRGGAPLANEERPRVAPASEDSKGESVTQSSRAASDSSAREEASKPTVSVAPPVAASRLRDPMPSDDVATLDAELALIRSAHAALSVGHAAEALASLDEHARRFPNGVLTEDRAAQRVLALCALDRSESAEREGERFVSSYPRSPYMAAIRSSCAYGSGPKK